MTLSLSVAKVRNVATNALLHGNLGVMAHKVWSRVADHVSTRERTQAGQWCATRAESADAFASSLDASLWEEALVFGLELDARGRERIEALGVELGGGGHYPLLFFLARYLKPVAVLETGVAAGFSSAAILEALDRNGAGALFSSDFPYFRLDRPERFVGVMVDDRLRDRWHLYLNGDRHNLPKILEEIGDDVPLVHYDSDKSPSGKRYFVDSVASRLCWTTENAFWIFDNVDDDLFFARLVEREDLRHRVFAFEGKYLGLIEFEGAREQL